MVKGNPFDGEVIPLKKHVTALQTITKPTRQEHNGWLSEAKVDEFGIDWVGDVMESK